MSGEIDGVDERLDENNEEKEPLQVDTDKNQESVTINVDAVPLNSQESARVRPENITFMNLDSKSLKSCCVVLFKKKCPSCEYIALTISAAVNVVLVLLIVVALNDKNNESSDESSELSLPQSHGQIQEEYYSKYSVCVKCINDNVRTPLQEQTFSTFGSDELCCKEDADSLKILANLITTEKVRQKTEEYIFLYIPSHYQRDRYNNKRKDSVKPELESKALRLLTKNKIIVETSGNYVIFFAVTKTSIRHGNLSISLVRYRDKLEELLSVSMDTRGAELSYNTLWASEVFQLHVGDSVTININGQENLYSFTKTNYFGMYRIG